MLVSSKRMLRWITAFAVVALTVTGCVSSPQDGEGHPGAKEERQALNWKVPPFQYTDQNGEPFGSSDLKGKVWIADMVFTRCPDVCPPMTANMVKLQKKLKAEGVEAEIVSFSVDPKHDTPKVLKKYGTDHGADFSNWHFLTGYSDKEIREFAKTAFKSVVHRNEPRSGDEPLTINHPVSFFLVDASGNVYQRYDGMKPDEEQIIRDIRQLRKQ